MLGMLCLAIHDLRRLLTTADVAASLSVEALLGSDAPFAEDLIGMRPHPGQAASASNMRRNLARSEEHTYEPQTLRGTSNVVFRLKNNKPKKFAHKHPVT